MEARTRSILLFAALLCLALLVHLLLGWPWTIAAGVAAGFVYERQGWLYGALVVGVDWLVLVLYNYLVDARAVGVMTDTMGAIMGNMPSFAIVAITILIGLLLGLVGGAAGSQLRTLLAPTRPR